MSDEKYERRYWMNPSGVLVPVPNGGAASDPSASTGPPRESFARIEPFLCWSELARSPLPKAHLVAYLRRFGRVPTFGMLAAAAATLANSGVKSRRARMLTTDRLIAERQGVRRFGQVVGDFVLAHRERVIAHERVICFLQAAALVFCDDREAEPTWADLAWLMLVANDHLDQPPDGTRVGWLEGTLANFVALSRFNVGGDHMAAMVRGYELTQTPPANGQLGSHEAWEALLREAFRGSFHDHYVEILLPIVLVSQTWGAPEDEGRRFVAPVLDPSKWFSETKAPPVSAAQEFARLSLSVEDAQKRLLARVDDAGLPANPMVFAHQPFLRLDDGTLIAASPWPLREQLRLGLWDRCRRQAKSTKLPDAEWNRAFGLSFEAWVGTAARRAASSPKMRGRVEVPEKPGTGELEDVVILEERGVMLGSAKSSLIPGDALLAAEEEPTKLIAWYERVLFAARQGDHRAGALHQLEGPVNRIRAGKAAGIASDARIYPVLITYERLGDSPVLYKWVHDRCRALGVLTQENVAPVTFVSASEWEWLLAAAARGVSVCELLERRSQLDDGLVPFDAVLRHFVDEREPLRLPGVEDKFYELMNETTMRLFGKPFERRGVPNTDDDDDD